METGVLPAAAAEAMGQLETYRELSDYNTQASFDGARAEAEIARAEAFIGCCRPLVR